MTPRPLVPALLLILAACGRTTGAIRIVEPHGSAIAPGERQALIEVEGPVRRVEAGGEELDIPPAGGDESMRLLAPILAEPPVAHIDVWADFSGGERRGDARDYLVGETAPRGEAIPNALLIFLGRGITSELSSALASRVDTGLIERELLRLPIMLDLGGPGVGAGGYSLPLEMRIREISIPDLRTAVSFTDEEIRIVAVVEDPTMRIEFSSPAVLPLFTTGNLTAGRMTAVLSLEFEGSSPPRAVFHESNLDIEEVAWELPGLPEALANAVSPVIENLIERRLTSIMEEELPGALGRLLSDLAITREISETPPISVSIMPSQLVHGEGTLAVGLNLLVQGETPPLAVRRLPRPPVLPVMDTSAITVALDARLLSDLAAAAAGGADRGWTIPTDAVFSDLALLYPSLANRIPASSPLMLGVDPAFAPIIDLGDSPAVRLDGLDLEIYSEDSEGDPVTLMRGHGRIRVPIRLLPVKGGIEIATDTPSAEILLLDAPTSAAGLLLMRRRLARAASSIADEVAERLEATIPFPRYFEASEIEILRGDDGGTLLVVRGGLEKFR